MFRHRGVRNVLTDVESLGIGFTAFCLKSSSGRKGGGGGGGGGSLVE